MLTCKIIGNNGIFLLYIWGLKKMENEFDLLSNQQFIQENLTMFKQHLLTQINFF